MSSLIVPSNIAQARRAQLAAAAPRGEGLGKMLHTEDPAKAILKQIGMEKLGELPGFRLHGNRVLVGVYKRPDTLESKIVIPDQTRDEDKFQGKAGLVLMLGHSAFKSDGHFDFGPDAVKPGDWISLWVSDGRSIIVNGVRCRVLRDQDINFVIPAPDAVY
jgi:co-chaperonin GroES (HSP10)